jgi:hypothetical protein
MMELEIQSGVMELFSSMQSRLKDLEGCINDMDAVNTIKFEDINTTLDAHFPG